MPTELSKEMREYFRKLGSKGGKVHSSNLSAAERKERARQAGIASGKVRKKKARSKSK
jgi:hypothetical protein